MNVTLGDFCLAVGKLGKTNAEKAIAILWYFDQLQPDAVKSAGELTKTLCDHHLGTPNQTALAEGIRKTKFANETRAGFYLKPGSRKFIGDWLPDLDGLQPEMDQSQGFLPQAVWKNTRGYIEAVCREVNGSYRHAYYNGAAVMLRRLLETLIIESYEHLGRDREIKNSSGHFYMLSDLTDRACGENGHTGLNLGRDSKKALRDARDVGNWSAHARRYLANSSDLEKLRPGMRMLVQELIQIANLTKK